MTPEDLKAMHDAELRVTAPDPVRNVSGSRTIMAWGDYGPESVTGQWSANTYDREDAVEYTRTDTIPSAAYVAGLEKAAIALEKANDELCSLRSTETYLSMIDKDGAADALENLDAARSAIRAALASSPASPDVRVVTRSQLQEWFDLLCTVTGDTKRDDADVRSAAAEIRAIIGKTAPAEGGRDGQT